MRAASPPGPLSSASDADVRADPFAQPDRIAAFRAAFTAQDRVCSACNAWYMEWCQNCLQPCASLAPWLTIPSQLPWCSQGFCVNFILPRPHQ